MKKITDKLFIIVGCIFCISVWIAFLRNPIQQAIKNSEIYLIIYYFIFFIFTIFAFINIPFILQSKFAYFVKTEKDNREILKSLDEQKYLGNKENKSIWDIYKSTFFKSSSGRICTMVEANFYFNTDSVMTKLAPRTIKYSHNISETFIGIGILGTFLGFSIGMKNIDISNVDNMISNIETLIHSGFATAFNTSIVGIICSVIYKFFIYTPQFDTMDNHFEELSDELDSEYYISSTQVIDAFNSDLVETLSDKIKEVLKTHVESIGDILTRTINDEVLNLKTALEKGTSQINEVIDKLSRTPDALGKTYDILEDRSNKFAILLNKSLRSLRENIEPVIGGLKESLGPLIEPIRKIESTYESIAKRFDETGKNISDSFAKTQSIVDTLVKVDDSTSKSLEKLVKAGEQIQKSIKDAEKALSGTETLFKGFTDVDAHLTDIFVKLNKHINDYIIAVSETYKKMLNYKKDSIK